jgi:hypothetical protein
MLVATIAFLWISDFQVTAGGRVFSARVVIEREISPAAFVSGAPVTDTRSTGTIYWRLLWWNALWSEDLADPNLLIMGRGYGPDLRDAVRSLTQGALNWDQGEDQGRPVRSPHSIAMTLLARSGLIGLGLWLLMLGGSFQRMVKATLAARVSANKDDELLGVWFISYLVLILVVSLFGVVLEAPHAAIPFFMFLGVGVGWATDRLEESQPLLPKPLSRVAKVQMARSRT